MLVYSKKQTQIEAQSGAYVRVLVFDKVFIKISVEYSDYSNIFFVKNVAKLLKNTEMNKHIIKPEKVNSHFSDLFIA